MFRVSLAIMLIPLVVQGQHTPQTPLSSFNSLISTPQAQQLQRYGDVPVDYSTGIPSISVPIGNIGIKNLDWPLELNYHAGGNKVGEVSSNVGLGWVQSGVGMISANIYGNPDTYFPLETDSMLMRRPLNLGANEPSAGSCIYLNVADKNRAEDVLVGVKNVLPDIYHLNLGSQTFKMFILGDSAYTMPSSDLKIRINRTYSGTTVTSASFFILDEKGTKYYFTTKGHNKLNGVCVRTRFSNSSNNYVFHLDSAVNVFNEKLVFYYSQDTYSYYMPIYRQEPVSEEDPWSPCYGIGVPAPKTCSNQYLAVEAKVDSILSSNGHKITFQYASRTDLPSTQSSESGGTRLNSIKFYYKSQLRYAYDLEQDYFISPGGTSAEYYRLRLKSLTLKDKNLISDQKYTFTYNSTQLPERRSNSIDSAGFFNGVGNSTNLPQYSDRSFDELSTKACILETIKYPTGGTTMFDYELNSPGYGGLRIKRITNTPVHGIPSVRKFVYTNRSHFTQSFINAGYSYQLSGTDPITCEFPIYQSLPNRILNYEYKDDYRIKYENVEELFGENGETGKITYRYANAPNYSYSDNDVPFVLTEKKQFKKNGSAFELIEKEYYTYNSFLDSTLSMFKNSIYSREKRVWGKEFTKFLNETWLTAEGGSSSYCCPTVIGEGIILLTSNPSLLSEKVTVTYDGGTDSIVTSEKYSYSIFHHLQPIKIETNNSRGERRYLINKYSTQYGSLTTADNLSKGVRYLSDRNIIELVESTQFVEKSGIPYVLSATFNSYNGTSPVLDTTLTVKVGSPILGTSFSPSINSAGKLLRDSRYVPHLIYKLYDALGNPLERYKYQDVKETYLWGYDSRYPVAKIVGADYATSAAQVSTSVLNNPSDDQALRTELNKLRTNLTTAQVTTYTYNPALGITSETDPAGRTTYYEYDAIGRLKLIKDQDSRIISHFEYRFQVPITQ